MSRITDTREVVPGIPAEFGDLIVSRRLNIVRQHAGFVSQDLSCLDAGCGNGASLLQLAMEFRMCHGVDANSEYIEQFRRAVEERAFANCTAATDDLCNTAIVPESFDRVISFEVIEHLPDERAGVRSLYRVLKSGGQIAVSVPNKWWIFETHGTWLPLLPWHRVPFVSWLPAPLHSRIAKARIYTKRRITALLSEAGFYVTNVVYVTAPMDRLTFRPLQTLARKAVFGRHTTGVPMLATSIMVFATKGTESCV